MNCTMNRLLPWGKMIRAALLILLSSVCATGNAQISTADVLGTVTDQSGAVVAGATVTLENLGTHESQTTVSTTAGQYLFNLVQSGHYAIEVEAKGFKKSVVPEVTLAAGDRVRINAQMDTGSVVESVDVNATSPALQTDSSSVGIAITEKAVQDLPLNGRNFVQLAQLTPGANEGPAGALSSGSRPDDRRQSSAISVNGQSDSLNSELIDGTDNNERMIATIGVRPSIDSISEFRVETNLYTAEVGRTAGAVINIITKSGTNNVHGTAYDFVRNTALNARNYFATTGPKPYYNQNQFGGSVGGPIRKNKSFFFGDYEGYRISQGITSLLTVPTLYEEKNPGDFTDIGGVKVASSTLSPIALQYFALYPAPNLPGAVNNFNSTSDKSQNSNTYDARVDQTLSEKDSIFARFTLNDVNTTLTGPLPVVDGIAPGGNISAFDGTSSDFAANGQVNYVRALRQNLLLELRTAYTRINNASFPLNYGTDVSQQFGLPGYNLSQFNSGLAVMYATGYATLGEDVDLPLRHLDNTYQYNGSIVWSHGAHIIKAGGSLIRRQSDETINFRPGFFVFAALNGKPGGAMQYFLQGVPYQVTRVTQLFSPGFRTWEPSGYVQDDWRATKSLTLNLGVRYDVFTPFTESHGRLSNFDPATASILVAGQNGVSSTANVSTDYRAIAPRLGFAESLSHGLVVRGGFGMSFFPSNYTAFAQLLNAPYVSTYGPVTYGTPQYQPLSAGLPATLAPQSVTNPSGSLTSIPHDFRNSYLEQFNLIVQKELRSNVFSLGYVGELGRRLGEPINNIDAPPPSTASNINLLRPYYAQIPNVTAISNVATEGISGYHALQATFERRLGHGLSINSNFTYAHGLNDVQNISAGSGGAYALLPNQIRSYDYGNSDLDQRYRFVFQGTYQIPTLNRSNHLARAVLGGWQVNAIDVWGTGFPFTVFDGTAQINTGVSTDRPDAIGTGKLAHRTVTEWFDPTQFVPQTKGTAGDVGRNTLYGPNQRHLDLSLFREFAATERFHVQLRAEAFDVLNTPNFAAPASSIRVAGVGSISSTTLDPREFQFAAKLLF